MITPNDFKKAIGKPDRDFENSVQQALQEVLLEEKRATRRANPIRYILPAAAVIAAAACAVFMFMRPDGQPDIVYGSSGVMSQPSARPVVTAAPTPQPEEAELPEQPAVTLEPTSTSNESGLQEQPSATTEPLSIPEEATSIAATENELSEQPEATVEPTPWPVSANLPEDHWMFADVFGADINSLYAGYTYSDTADDQYGNKFWMVSNGNQKLMACAISYGDIINYDSESGEYEAPSLHVYMLENYDTPERTEALMASAAPWLAEIYSNSCAAVNGTDQDTRLNSIKITFNEYNEPQFCELYFGLNCEVYISWLREEDTGKFTIIKLYTQPEYEFLDYDDPAEYDTMEVAFEDPLVEAAIRTELNWEGALTPAKLAEVEQLELNGNSISSLSGIEYCTNLTYLDLAGCGIGDENLKYVGSLPSLSTLILYDNNITDITNLSNLNLTFLQLSNNQISNLWPVSGMTSLRVLMLDDNQLSGDLKPLEALSNLEKLYMQRCGITDVYPIAELAKHGNLVTLDLSENPIEDCSPLEELDINELYYNK